MEVDTNDKWPIDKLPEEVLVEIFSFLDSKDLHELAKVRTDWKTLINGNAKTRKKLVLDLNCSSAFSAIDSSQKADLTFRYNTFEVYGCKSWFHASSTMRKFSNDLRRLCLEECEFDDDGVSNLVSILESLGNLEVLEMRESFYASLLDHVEPLKLKQLKSVTIDESNFRIFKLIGSSQLTRLEVSDCYQPLRTIKYIINFLSTQTMLGELRMFGINFAKSRIKARDIERMNFPLKRLSLEYQTNFMGGESNALAFLMKFANTLEELTLTNSFKSSYDLIFRKLQKLQILVLDSGGLPKDKNFYKTLPTLSSVKKLSITEYEHEHQKYVRGAIGHLPNIETLIISAVSSVRGNELMTFVSNNLLKLKNLRIHGLAGTPFKGVRKFESLRKLDIWSINPASDQDFSEMLEAMPNIEQSTFQRLNNKLNSEKFNALTRSWPQLRVLNLGRGFVPEAQMFNNLLARCPNITTVRVSGCEANHLAFKDFKKPGLRLIARRDMNFEKLENEKNPNLLNYY